MSFTLEYWDIPTAQGPYWIGPFHTLAEAQHAAGGHDADSTQLYLVRKGTLPGNNRVVSACLDGRWVESPSRRRWYEDLPDGARVRLQEASDRPLTGRQIIEIVLAGGTFVGTVTASGTPTAHLTKHDQRDLQQPEPIRPPAPPMELPDEAASGTTCWTWMIAAAVAAAVLTALSSRRTRR